MMQKVCVLSFLFVLQGNFLQARPCQSVWSVLVDCCKRPERRVISKITPVENEQDIACKEIVLVAALEKRLQESIANDLLYKKMLYFHALNHDSYAPDLLENAVTNIASSDNDLDVLVKNVSVRTALAAWLEGLKAANMTYVYSLKRLTVRLAPIAPRMRGHSVDIDTFLDVRPKPRSASFGKN